MAEVDIINIIQGTDRQFDLRVTKSNKDPKPLTDNDLVLELTLPGEDTNLILGLAANTNGSGLQVASAEGGRITVTIDDADTALLQQGDGQGMELKIQEGAGPNYTISKVQFEGKLTVKPMLFE